MPARPSAPNRAAAGALSAAITATIAAAVAVQTPRTAAHEGTRLAAYRDPALIWTICNGRTAGVTAGDRATPAQCAAWLRTDLAEHMAAAVATTPPLPEKPSALAQAGDFHFNAGARWWDRSPMRAHFLARRWRQGCEAFRGYVVLYRAPRAVAGGNCRRNTKGVLYCEAAGLVKRRAEERALCLAGL